MWSRLFFRKAVGASALTPKMQGSVSASDGWFPKPLPKHSVTLGADCIADALTPKPGEEARGPNPRPVALHYMHSLP